MSGQDAGEHIIAGKSLIDFGDLGKPATTLIEKVSEALGGAFRPGQIRRVAKAEADAAFIKALGQLDIEDYQRRALGRVVAEEGRNQLNMEAITEQALPMLGESARPEEIDEDWIVNFYAHARMFSNEEMQALWARVLAGEANKPGAFSRRTVNLMGSLDKSDAEMFTLLCRFNWQVDDAPNSLVYDTRNDSESPSVYQAHD
jgi:hypothetical protein